MNATTVNIEQLLPWTPPKLVDTSRGLRQVRKAEPTQEFWSLWRANKEVLKNHGISISKNDFGVWSVALWTDPSPEYLAKLAASQAEDADITIPAPPGLSYVGYQKAGVLFAHTDSTLQTLKPGVLIGDEMGLGKTIEAIGIINLHPELRKVLIVTPASIKVNWRNELRRWLVDDRTVGLAKSTELPDTDIVIINFDILKQNHHALLQRDFDLLIIDEAHSVRNTKTQRYAFLKPLAKKHVVALTGTPIWNKAEDLWALLTLLVPDDILVEKWHDWKKFRYCKENPKRQSELNRRLREYVMIRRMKADVLKELPPKRRQVIQLPTTGAAYDAVRAEIEAYQSRETRLVELRSAMLLAKVSDDRDAYHRALAELKYEAQVSFNELSRVRHQTVLAKLEHIVEHLVSLHEEDPSRKVIFFAHHRDVLEHISTTFGAPLVMGGMTPEAKQAAVDRFNTDPNCWLIGGSIRAMGLGFNMTSSSWVVFGELDWTPATVTQCEDRTHRMGQTADHIMVQHLTLEGSLDARMAHVILEKQEVMDRAVGSLETDEPVVLSMNVELVTLSNKELERERLAITDAQILAVHTALRILAGVCDYAQRRDDCGFNGCDAIIGHALAGQASLSPKQAVLGKKILKKYHRQIPNEIYGVIFN